MLNGNGTFAARGTLAEKGVWEYRSGLGAGVVNVPEGAFLTRVMADSTGAGATVQIGDGDVISLPSGGAFDDDIDGGKEGSFNVTFVGVRAYYIAWIQT